MRSRAEQVALKDASGGVRVPSGAELADLYCDQRLTIEEIAEKFGLTSARVLLLLRRNGIERRPARPRPERLAAQRAARRPPALVEEILALHKSGMSGNAVARRLNVHKTVVAEVVRAAVALHSYRIPVRLAGRRTSDAVVVLDALYADLDVVAILPRHGVPLRQRTGSLSQRFRRPVPLTEQLVIDLYQGLGLSAAHISLLTGHGRSAVLDALRRSGTPARSSSRSPWFERTILGQ